jgi:hypothetical protein
MLFDDAKVNKMVYIKKYFTLKNVKRGKIFSFLLINVNIFGEVIFSSYLCKCEN